MLWAQVLGEIGGVGGNRWCLKAILGEKGGVEGEKGGDGGKRWCRFWEIGGVGRQF